MFAVCVKFFGLFEILLVLLVFTVVCAKKKHLLPYLGRAIRKVSVNDGLSQTTNYNGFILSQNLPYINPEVKSQ